MAKQLKNKPLKRNLVANEISKMITSGELSPGERLATIRDISSEFQVSVSVVQNALKELANNHFIECRGASGFYVLDSAENKCINNECKTSDKLFIIMCHHSDLIWRRTFKGYADLRDEQFSTLFNYAEKYPEMVFMFEESDVAKDFFERHPELIAKAKQYINEGRLELSAVCSIPDMNMICGEALIRNIQIAQNYYSKTFGVTSDFIRLSDAFGMPAQLPQILDLCNIHYLIPGRMPNTAPEIKNLRRFLWKGLDGESSVLTLVPDEFTHLGYDTNVPQLQSHDLRLIKNLMACTKLQGSHFLQYFVEEGLLLENVFPAVAEINRETGRCIEFGNIHQYAEENKHDKLISFSGEFNPVFTGCYTTRISVKQRIRTLENALFKAEYISAVEHKKINYDNAWRTLAITQFHDAICGCHTDEVNAEIHKLIDSAQINLPKPEKGKVFAINFNNTDGKQIIKSKYPFSGVPSQKDGDDYISLLDLPSFGIKKYNTAPSFSQNTDECDKVFETKFFKVDFTGRYPKIQNKKGKNIFPENKFGEIVVRRDTGSMWTESFWNDWQGDAKSDERVISAEKGDVFYEIKTSGAFKDMEWDTPIHDAKWNGFEKLSFEKTYRFYHELDYFTLHLKINWIGCNAKIAVKFPVKINIHDGKPVYETPFGCATRNPYFEVPYEYAGTLKQLNSQTDYYKANGDWPALNWVNYSDNSNGLTVANTGTPGHYIAAGNIYISLIRSGTATQDGRLTPDKGSYDNGTHDYDFAIAAHSRLELDKAYLLGAAINRTPEIVSGNFEEGSMLAWKNKNIAVSAVKETKDGVILRLYETIGRQSKVKISGDMIKDKALFIADANGNTIEKITEKEIIFLPFEIKTFVAKKERNSK